MSKSAARSPESNVSIFFARKSWSILALFGLCLLLLSAFFGLAQPFYTAQAAPSINLVANSTAAVKPHAGTVFTVTNTAGSGSGSLYDAVQQSNAAYDGTNPNTINFNISTNDPNYNSKAGTFTISVTNSIVITAPVTVDGLNGANCGTPPKLSIVLDGSGLPSNSYQASIQLNAGSDGSVIRGLVINNNTSGGDGIDVNSNNNTIECNFIGMDASGTVEVANGGDGILINGTGNTIGNPGQLNLISGNGSSGIDIESSDSNVIAANYIGTDINGTSGFGNGNDGILIVGNASTNNLIGGSTTASRNIISGNSGNGIDFEVIAPGIAPKTSRLSSIITNTVINNYVGTDATGTTALGNSNVGIEVSGFTNVQIGQAGQGNLISGNSYNGIELDGADSVFVQANYIGTDKNGANAVANGGNGISLDGSSQGVVIGGSDASSRNIISGNSANGIQTLPQPYYGLVIQPSLNGKTHKVKQLSQPKIKSTKTPVKSNKPKIVATTITNTIISNYIGTDVTGNAPLANAADGILVADVTNVQIGQPGQGNLISGNGFSGIHLTTGFLNYGSTNIFVQSNLIGTNAAGTGSLPNQQGGIDLDQNAQQNTIGGSAAGTGNTVSGNDVVGIGLAGSQVLTNTVEGNYVGTDPTGATAVPNVGSGIFVGYSAQNNFIGVPGVGNLVSGNSTVGIQFTSSGISNTVQNNYVGTNKAGTAALPNSQAGISLEAGSAQNIIGGAGAGNIVSGNNGNGIEINGNGTNANIVQSNFIGTDSTGNNAIPNQLDGVNVYLGQSNLIGGTANGEGNVIANNLHNGVSIGSTISDTQTIYNSINQNSIFANSGLGIDLGNDGVTFNNPTVTTGPNDLQPFPVISAAVQSNGNYNISGSLTSVPSTPFLVEFFANATCSPSGHGQGQSYLGSTIITTSSAISPTNYGSATFSVAFPLVSGRQIVAATATNTTTGDTSEFSNCQPGDVNLLVGSSVNPSVYGQSVTLSATVSPTPPNTSLPTGTVVFTDTLTNTKLGTATLSAGVAMLPVTNLGAGVHNILVTYSGDGNYPSSTTTFLQVVNKAATSMTLTSNPNPPLPDQNVTFTATVTVVPLGAGTPTGVVTFTDATTNAVLGTSPLGSNGVATLTVAGSTVQSHNINVQYSGDANFAPSAVINGNASNPAKLVFLAEPGNGQPGQPLTVQPIVAVEDIYGNTIANYTGVISLTLINNATGATLGGSVSVSVTNGLATFSNVSLDKVGNGYSLLAQSNSLTGLSTSFNVAAGPIVYIYTLPFLANGYTPSGTSGSFTTYLAFQNIGSSSATVSVSYFDANGNSVTTPSGTCTSLTATSECLPPNPFASGSFGTGVITSTQPLNVIVSEGTPYGGSAYAINSNGAAGSNSLIAPFALNNSFGGFVTQLTVFNFGTSSTTATVNFYSQDGTAVTASSRTLTLAPHTSQTLDQSARSSNLPNGFNGWAQIQGTGSSQLVAQVLEQNPGTHFVALINAVTSPQTTLYAPTMLNGAFGGFVSGSNIINPNADSVTVNVTYYGTDGTIYPASPFSLPAHAIASIYQGATSAGIGLPSTLLPANFSGGAVVSVSGGGAVMAVNESAGLTSAGTARSGTYTAVSSGSNVVGLPAIANGGSGFTSGLTVFNVSSSPVSGTIQYYNVDGTPVNGPQAFNVGPHSSYAVYQGAANLPAGFYGTAVVTQSSDSQSNAPNALIVTTNMQSASFFYTYTEQNN